MQKNPDGLKYIVKARNLGVDVKDSDYLMLQALLTFCTMKQV